MSMDIETEVWKYAPVSSGTLLVLLALADNADTISRTCWPGISSLARRARLSERQVKRCIRSLQSKGILRVRPNASPLKTNLYTITIRHDWPALDGAEMDELDNMSPPEEEGRCDTHVTSDRTPTSHQIGQYVTSDVTSATPRCDMGVPSDVTPMSPKPSGEPSEEPLPLPTVVDGLTDREEILIASGHDKSGMTASGRMVGNANEMLEVARWRDDLGLSQEKILIVIGEAMTRKPDGPPNTLKYFTKPMQRFAFEKSKPNLTATEEGKSHERLNAKTERLQSIVTRAARGTSDKDWG